MTRKDAINEARRQTGELFPIGFEYAFEYEVNNGRNTTTTTPRVFSEARTLRSRHLIYVAATLMGRDGEALAHAYIDGPWHKALKD